MTVDLHALVAEAAREDLPTLVGQLATAHAEALSRIAGPVAPPDNELLTPVEAAARLKVEPSHVYEQIRRGRLPSVKTGKYVRIPAAALAEHLRRATRGYTSGT